MTPQDFDEKDQRTPEETLEIDSKIYLLEEGKTKVKIARLKEITLDRLILEMMMTDEAYAHGPGTNAKFRGAAPSDKCTYRFESTFCGSSPLPDHLWFMERPAFVVRQQKRDFVRVPSPIPMHVTFFNDYGGKNKAKATTLVDISGNGAAFVWKEEIENGTELEIEVPDLPVIGTLQTKAVVMRSIDRTALATPVYHIGVNFLEYLDRREQHKLVRGVFLLQRKYLERGLGI